MDFRLVQPLFPKCLFSKKEYNSSQVYEFEALALNIASKY